MRILKLIGLLLGLTAPAAAGPYYSLSLSTTTGKATENVSGTINVAKSSATASTATIVLDGPSGSIFVAGATVTYGLTVGTFTATSSGTIAGSLDVSGSFSVGGTTVIVANGILSIGSGQRVSSFSTLGFWKLPPIAQPAVSSGTFYYSLATGGLYISSNGVSFAQLSTATTISAGSITGGTLAASVLLTTANVQNGFNAANQFLQIGPDGKLPTIDGSKVTGLVASSTQTTTNYIFTATLNFSSFVASGVFTVPAAKNNIVYVTACGGGAGGNGNLCAGNGCGGGGGGGAGNAIMNAPVSVVGVTSITVTVGAGGTAGNNSQGTNGGNTIVTVNQSASFYVLTATGGFIGATAIQNGAGGGGGNGGCGLFGPAPVSSTGTAGTGFYFPSHQIYVCGASGGGGGDNLSSNARDGGAGGSLVFSGGAASHWSGNNGGGGGGGASIMAAGSAGEAGSTGTAGLCAGGGGGVTTGDAGGGGFVNIYWENP